MKFMCALVLVCVLLLGVTGARANELELKVSLPRIVGDVATGFDRVAETEVAEWHRQLGAGKAICPTVQELYASRQQLAREALNSPNPRCPGMGRRQHRGVQ